MWPRYNAKLQRTQLECSCLGWSTAAHSWFRCELSQVVLTLLTKEVRMC